MKRAVKAKCRGCGREFLKKDLNRRGYCSDCAMKRMLDVWKSLHEKKGYWYEKWMAGMLLWAKKLEQEKHKKKTRKPVKKKSKRR